MLLEQTSNHCELALKVIDTFSSVLTSPSSRACPKSNPKIPKREQGNANLDSRLSLISYDSPHGTHGSDTSTENPWVSGRFPKVIPGDQREEEHQVIHNDPVTLTHRHFLRVWVVVMINLVTPVYRAIDIEKSKDNTKKSKIQILDLVPSECKSCWFYFVDKALFMKILWSKDSIYSK